MKAILDEVDAVKREKARRAIVSAANAHRLKHAGAAVTPSYSLRRLQQAVFCCRQAQLVSAKTLHEAGFRERRHG